MLMYSLTQLYYVKYNFLKYDNEVALVCTIMYLIIVENTKAVSHLKIINIS